MNRIDVRTLIYQHIFLTGDEFPQHSQQMGIIDTSVDVVGVIKDAYTTAKYLFGQASYSVSEIEIVSYNVQDHGRNGATIVCIPSHLYHIAFELLKNSLRATIERFGFDSKEYSSVRVLIVKGHEDLTIQIADYDGGISLSKLSQFFHFMYPTAPLVGLGYGLPIIRLYAKYF